MSAAISACSMAVVLVLMVVLVAVNSQTYPRFEIRGSVLTNNSYIFRGNISESQNDSLHCVTDNSDCCNNGQGNWYDATGEEVQQGPDGNSRLHVTRGDGVVYLNRRRGGQSGMWRCDIPDNNGVQQSIYIYFGTSTTGLYAYFYVILDPLSVLETTTGRLSSAVIYFTLDSEANEDPPEFTLTCQSRGGPVTEVEWTRNGVRVEEDSNHMTSQIIVHTLTNTVYDNTLRVRGRESGTYICTVSNNRHEYVAEDGSQDGFTAMRVIPGMLLLFV